MKFMMIINNPEIARFVCAFDGVEPFVDLEVLGKSKRQGHMPSWKSKHTLDDVERIRAVVPEAHLIVRINPMNENTAQEIEEVVARGADSVMLPMFYDHDTLARFLDLLGDKAVALPLFETASSVVAVPEIVPKLNLRRLHIGLNDLHLDLGQNFLFQPLSDGFLEGPTEALREYGTEFGIGGIARAKEGIISPEHLLGEHVRLGSSAAILSQTFHRNAATLEKLQEDMDFAEELGKLKQIFENFRRMDNEAIEKNRIVTHDRINNVVSLIRQRRGCN